MKKVCIISCVFVLIVILGINHLFAAPCGDTNSDGNINITDALLIAQASVGGNPSNFDKGAADVNGDGNANITDALLVAQYYVGIIDTLPCQSSEPTTGPGGESEYQAEDAIISEGVIETEHSGYTGSGYANVENNATSYIEFNVYPTTSGSIPVVFRYANGSGSDRPMEISVNGSLVNSSLSFPDTGEWTSWSTVSINVNLNSGHNTIRAKSITDTGGPNLDKITIGTTSNTPQPTTPQPTTAPPTPSNAIYAAPNGSSSNGGTSFSDAFDIKTALGRVAAGQTLLLQAGTYNISYSGSRNTIFLTKSGSSSNPIRIEGYNGQAKLNFSAPEGEWTQDSWGLEITGDYYYFKNIDITRAAYQGAYVMGSHNTFEECNFYNNRNTGLEINEGGEYTTVINCDAYDNYDPKKNGGMADGFAAKQEQGRGNKFIGCNAWGNSDDGYDNYDSSYAVIYENCTANSNGTYDGNGNGFKLGGNDVIALHILTNCVANNNRKHGFHANSNPGPITLINCSASGNGENDFNGDFVIQ